MKNNGFAWREVARAFDYLCPGIGACLLGLAAGPAFQPQAHAADVYVSRSPEGVPVYTNQAQDVSSRLFLKGTSEPFVAGFGRGPRDNESLRKRREALEPLIQDVSARHGLDPSLLRAIAHVESQFDNRAVSPAGARGLMQLMPGTAKRYGTTDRADPAQNLDAGARYFKDLLTRYAGNLALALAAYNSGEANVERHARRVPPFRETMLYVPEVLTRYESYRQAEAAKTR
ncbi:MAG: lytic transglycosylase protein [Betaproteobacteria bacterium]|nr:lytic transglycosylase protein [Betaproteobacteria bacterium]